MTEQTKTTKVMKVVLVGIFTVALVIGIASLLVGGDTEAQDTYTPAPATQGSW